jgi:tetratricopeptide (TPR) repeat protein
MKALFTLFTCLMVGHAVAQPGMLEEANDKYRAGDLAAARDLLDRAIRDPQLAALPEAWVLRGFVYKDLFKAEGSSQAASLLRDEAMASLLTAFQEDPDGQYKTSTLPAYDYLSRTIYNDAVNALGNMAPDSATALYGKYKEAVLRLSPDSSFTARDIDFGNALGTVQVKLFNQDRSDLRYYDQAVRSYLRVLELDPANYGANYNLATLYYNRGVHNIQQIDADNDIPSLQQVQAASREFFSLALPFMEKAHLMDPRRKETLIGLEGIYYSLQDEEKSSHYRHLYEELKPDER